MATKMFTASSLVALLLLATPSHGNPITSTTITPDSTTVPPDFTTVPPGIELPEGVCDPSLLYGLSPFEGDGSVETLDFNQYEIYYNQTTLIGFDESIVGWTYFGYVCIHIPPHQYTISKILKSYPSYHHTKNNPELP